MREIKFRAWDKKGKEMFRLAMISFLDKGEIILTGRGGSTDNKNAILMQYTGLKDKNGKEIYEGDIVKCHESIIEPQKETIYLIIWDDEHAAFTQKNKENSWGLGYMKIYPVEIIGNAYENPELLKEA